jgi:quinol monooxygenase YgiN
MPFASITRLRLRSIRFVPRFIYDAFRALQQARASDGCLAADVRTIKARVFWTRTLWRDGAAMSAYRASGAHRATMPKLQHWCDEAAVVHWEQETAALPPWSEAEARMRAEGRLSRVRYPSSVHARGETLPTA